MNKVNAPFRCNACDRPVAVRSRNRCAYCGAAISAAQRFTPEQAEFFARNATGHTATGTPVSLAPSWGWWTFDCISISADIACAALESIVD